MLLGVVQRNLTIKVNIHHHSLSLLCLTFGRTANAPFNIKGTPYYLKLFFRVDKNKTTQ